MTYFEVIPCDNLWQCGHHHAVEHQDKLELNEMNQSNIICRLLLIDRKAFAICIYLKNAKFLLEDTLYVYL